MKVLEVARFLDTPDIMLRQVSEEVDLEELRLVGCPALTDATVGKFCLVAASLDVCFLRTATL